MDTDFTTKMYHKKDWKGWLNLAVWSSVFFIDGLIIYFLIGLSEGWIWKK